MRAMFVLTPAESKRLIAKAVASMDEVKWAKDHDRMLICHGSTNALLVEEVMGRQKAAELWEKESYLSGVIMRGYLCTIPGKEKPPILVLNKGKAEAPAPTMSELLRDFGPRSVFIKGANAVDPEGNAGAFVANREGGTIGYSIGMILARGIRLIVPVGLEKLIPSVKKALGVCGQQTYDYCQGLRVGMIPLSGGTVVTEIEALTMLCGVQTQHVGSGGMNGSEGAVTLVVEGEAEKVRAAIQLIESVKGEPPLKPRKEMCFNCHPVSPATLGVIPPVGLHCHCEGKKEEDLPPYLRMT